MFLWFREVPSGSICVGMETGIQGEVDGAGRISQIPKVRLRDSRSFDSRQGRQIPLGYCTIWRGKPVSLEDAGRCCGGRELWVLPESSSPISARASCLASSSFVSSQSTTFSAWPGKCELAR